MDPVILLAIGLFIIIIIVMALTLAAVGAWVAHLEAVAEGIPDNPDEEW